MALLPRLDRTVLLAPDAVARAAARYARRPEEKWLLRQPRPVRAGYVREVLDLPEEPHAEEIWMLSQDQPVRETYISQVLRERPHPDAD